MFDSDGSRHTEWSRATAQSYGMPPKKLCWLECAGWKYQGSLFALNRYHIEIAETIVQWKYVVIEDAMPRYTVNDIVTMYK